MFSRNLSVLDFVRRSVSYTHLIILGGIYSGMLTATESAAIAVV